MMEDRRLLVKLELSEQDKELLRRIITDWLEDGFSSVTDENQRAKLMLETLERM